MKKNKLRVHTTIWVNLTGIVLSDKCDPVGMKFKGRQNESVFIKAERGYFWGRYKLERCMTEANEVLEMLLSLILVESPWVQRKVRKYKAV